MGFSSKRGRPKLVREKSDKGTKEFQKKKARGVTSEPLDLCLKKGFITPDQHWAGLHLRWLYTLHFGVPTVSSVDLDVRGRSSSVDKYDDEWRAKRELEYGRAVFSLSKTRLKNVVMDLCVYNKFPKFLILANDFEKSRNYKNGVNPKFANVKNIVREKGDVQRGLDMLVKMWVRA